MFPQFISLLIFLAGDQQIYEEALIPF